MNRHTIVIAADKRQEKLLKLLEGDKTDYIREADSTETEVCEKIYVLPIPVNKLDRNPEIKEQNGILVCYVDIHCKKNAVYNN